MLRQEECLQHLFEGRFSTAGISNVVRQQIPDNGTGDNVVHGGALESWQGSFGPIGQTSMAMLYTPLSNFR